MYFNQYLYLILLFFTFSSCISNKEEDREQIDLKGTWQFALDTTNVGIEEQWFLSDLNQHVELPGTTDSNKKGFLNTDTVTSHLSRVYKYEGVAWYQKKIVVPKSFENKRVRLVFERTKSTKVWIDSTFIGGSKILQSPQEFEVSDFLSPGEHIITVAVDNRLELTPYRETHIFSDETQTNWNGIIGDLFIEAMPKTYVEHIRVFPDIDRRKIDLELEIKNDLELKDINIELVLERRSENREVQQLSSKSIDTAASSLMTLEYHLGDEMLLWDEYQQPLYQLTAVISGEGVRDSKSVSFGMRDFTANESQFEINKRSLFLRGKHEAAVFPISGHTPMDIKSWVRVFKIAKSYGINHYRFHSYTPPKAAFIAADQVGIYLQVELPFWGGLDSDTTAMMLRKEGFALLKAFANHPSFVMLSHGNEIWSGHDRVAKNISALKAYDDRPLYTMGSNNNIGYVGPRKVSDFFVASRTPSQKDTTLTHTRLTHAFVDSWEGGLLNTSKPSTEINFDYPVSQIDIPMVSHEVGQYQIYPNYDEINKYKGVLQARNLEEFRRRLEKAGMGDQDSVFQAASGAWSARCYKAEMEAALRTKGLAGFQLLDLQDFPGQGTALVGILDAFMDSKGVISRKKWLQSCNDVSLLLEFPKYVWTTNEAFKANLKVANYSNRILDKTLYWELISQEGKVIKEGKFPRQLVQNKGLTSAGDLILDLSSIKKARKLLLKVVLKNTDYSNTYPIWVYPEEQRITDSGDILIAEKLDSNVFSKLNQGGKVLLFPDAEEGKRKSIPGLFPPDFWNYEMFHKISEDAGKASSSGTLGLLTDPEHPLFSDFPTDFHTNWQWFSIVKHSNAFILDDTSPEYRPIVQVIDNLQRNHKLGLIFEFKVGDGKLLVCMSKLSQIMDKPEVKQLYNSILGYMKSKKFNPQYEFENKEELFGLFKG